MLQGVSLLILVSVASWTWLSGSFIYGQDHAGRPVFLFLTLYLGTWVLYSFACVRIARGAGVSIRWGLTVAILARLVLLPSNPIQEADFYRYTLDGNLVLQGYNPYSVSPLRLSLNPPQDLDDVLAEPSARMVLDRVSYPEIRTVYPPAAQAAFALGAALTGWNWMGQRLVFTAAEFLALLLMLFFFKSAGIDPRWLPVYAWNPLILKEVINSCHVDILVLVFLLASSLFLEKFGPRKITKKEAHRWDGYLVITALAMAAAILSKLYPILLLPATILFVWRRHGSRAAGLFTGWTGGLTLLGFLPFLTTETGNIVSGLAVYAARWQINEGAFSLLQALFPQPRLVAALIILAVALAVPLLKNSRTVRELCGQWTFILLTWFLMSPAPFPWYAIPIIGLLATVPSSSKILMLLGLTGALSLYYLNFVVEYQDLPLAYWTAVRVTEHGIIWLTVLLSGLLAAASAVVKPR